MSTSTDSIRNVAVVGHGSTGKTAFVEHLLFTGGTISKPETVESGKTVSDYTEEEVANKQSVHATLSNLQWKDGKINIMDTPGASDFVGEVVAALRVCESAAVMVAARAGVLAVFLVAAEHVAHVQVFEGGARLRQRALVP